jgi:Domain of unknown function (DUF4167)
MKRQRGRGRKPGGGGGGHHHNNNQGGHMHPNRTLDSSGPEGKVRGPASVIYERYLQLGRDASSAGDRVLAENFLQHADHYFRLVRSMQPANPPPQERQYQDNDYESEHDNGEENGGDFDHRARDDQPAGFVPQAPPQAAPHAAAPSPQAQDRGEGDFRRNNNRRRRNRFRTGEAGEEGEAPREPREASPDDRRPRDGQREEPADEGFSNSPRPAFLRQD